MANQFFQPSTLLNNEIRPEVRELISLELEPGEAIVWSGMPRRAFFTPASIGAFLFGIPWTAFAIFWTFVAGAGVWFTTGFSVFSFFPLFGLPFIIIGIGMLSSPLFVYLKSGKTAYVVTDRRAISFEGGRSTLIRSFPPEKLGNVYRREKRNGFGDVIIEFNQWRDSDGDKQTEELGFLRIRDAKNVERLLKDLGKKAGAKSRQGDQERDTIYKY